MGVHTVTALTGIGVSALPVLAISKNPIVDHLI